MKARILLFFWLSLAGAGQLLAQRHLNYRLHFAFSPTYSIGSTFENGSKVAATPNITGTHHIYSLFSILWGRPNPQYTPMQNFARKFTYSLLFEAVLSRKHSLTTGLEVGACGYGIYSEQSDNFIIMYRVWSLPLFYTHTNRLGTYWKLRKHVGVAMNRASSVEKFTFQVLDIKSNPTFYPTVFAGLELSYLQQKGPFSYSLEYHHGFFNVINHRYYALDYKKGQQIYSRGSHFRLSVKWFFASGSMKIGKGQKKIKEEEKHTDLDPIESLIYRNVKFPVEVKVKNSKIKICLRDDQTLDYDSIAIEYNDYLLDKTVGLAKEEKCYEIEVKSGQANKLVIHALNLGKIPPNTYEVIYYDGDKREVLRLKSDMENSSSVNFTLEDPTRKEE